MKQSLPDKLKTTPPEETRDVIVSDITPSDFWRLLSWHDCPSLMDGTQGLSEGSRGTVRCRTVNVIPSFAKEGYSRFRNRRQKRHATKPRNPCGQRPVCFPAFARNAIWTALSSPRRRLPLAVPRLSRIGIRNQGLGIGRIPFTSPSSCP